MNSTYVSYTRGLLGVRVRLDHLVTLLLLASVAFAAFIILAVRLLQRLHSYHRQAISASSTAGQQSFFAVEQSAFWPSLKNHLLYAPLGRKRHNREFRLSAALNVGTLPSRFHTVLLVLYLCSQLAYCLILDYAANNKAALIAELRGRSGNLAVLNMIPLFLLAGRNNPLIPLLCVSFDTYNLLHRWLGRIVVIEAVVHTAAWMVNAVDAVGFEKMWHDLTHESFFVWGFVATLSMVFILLQSPSPVRHAFYETFLHLHQLGVLIVVLGVYVHLDHDKLPQLPWVQLIIAIWACERGARLLRILRMNVSRKEGLTRVIVKALPGEACRVTFHLPRKINIGPGCHVYAYLPRISYWMSHPFSIAWTDSPTKTVSEKPATDTTSTISLSKASMTSEKAILKSDKEKTTVTLVVSARTGMTRKLYNLAISSPNTTFETSGLLEGPYSSHPASFASYGTVVLFAAGAGITHNLMHVRHLLASADEGTAATRRIYLVWAVRTTEHLAWIRAPMDAILHMPRRREILVTKLFVSKPRCQREVQSPSATLQMFPGRCRPDVVLGEALEGGVGAVGVSVCGPGAFADEVRAAVRRRIGDGQVLDFVEEAFTW